MTTRGALLLLTIMMMVLSFGSAVSVAAASSNEVVIRIGTYERQVPGYHNGGDTFVSLSEVKRVFPAHITTSLGNVIACSNNNCTNSRANDCISLTMIGLVTSFTTRLVGDAPPPSGETTPTPPTQQIHRIPDIVRVNGVVQADGARHLFRFDQEGRAYAPTGTAAFVANPRLFTSAHMQNRSTVSGATLLRDLQVVLSFEYNTGASNNEINIVTVTEQVVTSTPQPTQPPTTTPQPTQPPTTTPQPTQPPTSTPQPTQPPTTTPPGANAGGTVGGTVGGAAAGTPAQEMATVMINGAHFPAMQIYIVGEEGEERFARIRGVESGARLREVFPGIITVGEQSLILSAVSNHGREFTYSISENVVIITSTQDGDGESPLTEYCEACEYALEACVCEDGSDEYCEACEYALEACVCEDGSDEYCETCEYSKEECECESVFMAWLQTNFPDTFVNTVDQDSRWAGVNNFGHHVGMGWWFVWRATLLIAAFVLLIYLLANWSKFEDIKWFKRIASITLISAKVLFVIGMTLGWGMVIWALIGLVALAVLALIIWGVRTLIKRRANNSDGDGVDDDDDEESSLFFKILRWVGYVAVFLAIPGGLTLAIIMSGWLMWLGIAMIIAAVIIIAILFRKAIANHPTDDDDDTGRPEPYRPTPPDDDEYAPKPQ